ncbi:MAG: NAD(P)/FAD-dependent oxidoreductase [Acidimicrobiales bacterium]
MSYDSATLTNLVGDAKPAVFWTDRSDRPDPAPPLGADTTADLTIIGGGFTGLWAALVARSQDPGRDVLLLEAEVCGFGASTRNGGFCSASLTHGILNGLNHWPDEIDQLIEMGYANLDQLIADCRRAGIEAGIERTGQLQIATADWQVDKLVMIRDLAAELGLSLELLDQEAIRGQVASPTYLQALLDRRGTALLDPARLAWGLRAACLDAGVRIHEQTRVRSTEQSRIGMVVATDGGSVSTARVIVATNAWAEPERAIRRYVIPIYDHVLMSEPLSAEQMSEIGWQGRQGIEDSGNQFHYYRLTGDNRILWGGYDAIYHRGNGMGLRYELQTDSHELLAGHFFDTFPQLEGLGFTHRWAGPIGTTSKFTAAFGRGHGGALVWIAGYTGLGVGASRWGARTALDLVDGVDSERTRLTMVRRKPFPFPPEPLRHPLVQFTRRQLAQADGNRGQEGLWLRLLTAFGIGFDS